MNNKTFKKMYAGALIFVGIAVIGTIFVTMYGSPIYDRQLNAMKTETILTPSGRYHGLAECLEMIIAPIFVYMFFVFVAGCGVFWFKEVKTSEKTNSCRETKNR